MARKRKMVGYLAIVNVGISILQDRSTRQIPFPLLSSFTTSLLVQLQLLQLASPLLVHLLHSQQCDHTPPCLSSIIVLSRGVASHVIKQLSPLYHLTISNHERRHYPIHIHIIQTAQTNLHLPNFAPRPFRLCTRHGIRLLRTSIRHCQR